MAGIMQGWGVTRTASTSFRSRAAAIGRGLGRGVGATLDGLTIGLVIGFIVAVAISAPTKFLGVPPVLASVVLGGALMLLAGVGAAIGLAIRWLLVALADGLLGIGRIRRQSVAGGAIRFVSGIVRGLPAGWLGALVVLLRLALEPATIGPLAVFLPAGALAPFVYLTGASVAVWSLGRILTDGAGRDRVGGLRRGGATVLRLAVVVSIVTSATLALVPGSGHGLVAYQPAFDGATRPTALSDPGDPGPYAVETLSYGSGSDTRRPAFGAAADLRTESADASAILRRLGHGSDEARAWFWGFDRDALPLQGLVWMPAGPGPYPLVLMVHGNHAMGDFSEDGYAYLGQHLASRGSIAVSVDEDFLNGSWADDWRGDEQLARAWLLLLHLDQWRTWAADPATPLHGRVDLERIALIGHSRGGEAAAVAASIATRAEPPDARLTRWPTGLDIDAVIALAPSEGQYRPGSPLSGVDYLTMAGGHDPDARAWSGIRQYARSTPDPDGFKAALWAYRANHGQFNTVWGRDDSGPMSQLLLDVAPLITAEEQQDLARTAIGAFLEQSLHGRTDYRGLFQRPMVGREWLPDDIVVVRSATGGTRPLTTAGRAVDDVGVAVEQATVETRSIPLRALQPDQAIRGDLLRWEPGEGSATWSLTGLETLTAGEPVTAVSVALADAREPGDQPLERLRIAITARTTTGAAVSVHLDEVGALPPPLPVRLVKDATVAGLAGIDATLRSPVERVLQTYVVDIASLLDGTSPDDVGRLASIQIDVERSSDGALWIAEPGLVP